ncbi:Ephrin type-A receptor 6 [Collichthys lucidus]|uniref:Ephrin type-A receptor 6 n=1 Tax=Collichthys lucidus TaxID=240159 RepID=A0A4U5U7I9_COLLU|nr:Ephrin type-A receptor 6 [Collichthys lucidus]
MSEPLKFFAFNIELSGTKLSSSQCAVKLKSDTGETSELQISVVTLRHFTVQFRITAQDHSTHRSTTTELRSLASSRLILSQEFRMSFYSMVLLDTTTVLGELDWKTYPVNGTHKASHSLEFWRLKHSRRFRANPISIFYPYAYPLALPLAPSNGGARACLNRSLWRGSKPIPYPYAFVLRRIGIALPLHGNTQKGGVGVYVELRFTLRDCNSIPWVSGTCKETFNLFYLQTDEPLPAGTRFRTSDYAKVDTIAADESFTQTDLGDRVLRLNTEVREVGPVTHKGFYLAFQDVGACIALVSVKVFYKRCPSTLRNLAAFPDTVPHMDSSSLVEVRGACVENAEERDTPKLYCGADGDWLVPLGRCVCSIGHEEMDGYCRACKPGSFKAYAGNTKCSKCPPHSSSHDQAATICHCDKGFYRAIKDSSAMACTRPPSAPRNLVSLINDTALFLQWMPPGDTGGRKDITYNILCQRCDGSIGDVTQCEPCEPDLRFIPRSLGLTGTSVAIIDYATHANYTFHVEAVNGVSGLGVAARSLANVTVNTHQAGPALVGVVRKDWATQNSIALSWSQVEQPPSDIVDYEVKYYEKEQEQLSYSSTRTKNPSVVVTGLRPSTVYVFHVRARTAAGYTAYSPNFVFATAAEDPDIADQGQVLVVVTASVGGFSLLVILTLFLLITGRCQGYIKARMKSEEKRRTRFHSGHVPFSGIKTYVDPDTYEDPTQAVEEFAKEIEPSYICIERVIGAGEFGEVCSGRLRVPGRMDIAVAIKTLKGGYMDQQRQDFLREASIMGQFNNPNIVRLEGVVTKSRPVMIVVEYMENGALDSFLRTRDGQFTVLQLVGMMRGISVGMTYLSEMGYVHRDLAARNILVDENLVCKVSDFGMSRILEDDSDAAYTATGGKIPIRWTAPEAIAYGKFSSASDVWSFGIVMWEVMSYGERPYWEMSNQDVILSIEEGYRLPAPMGCPVTLHQLMLHCWQKESSQRPRFNNVLSFLDKLIINPSSLLTLVNDVQSFPDSPEDMPDYPLFISIGDWLDSIKMSQYKNNFLAAGYTTLDSISTMSIDDIRRIGICLIGHQRRIISSIQSLRLQLHHIQQSGFQV